MVQTNEVFSEQILYTGKSGRDIEVGDWNSDGNMDILVSLYANTTNEEKLDVVGLFYDGTANFTVTPLLGGAERTNGIRLGDLDGDNDLDLVLGFDGDFRVLAAIQEGDDIAVYALSDVDDNAVHGLDIGDLNADGILDIVYADFDSHDLNLITIDCIANQAIVLSSENTTCGENNGTATVDVSNFNNPTIEWSDGQTTATISDLAVGEYSVTVSDASGCSSTGSVIIEAATVTEIDITGNNTTCGNANGTATVSLISGANITSYLWNTGETTASIQNLSGGMYSVTATDANGCEITNSIEITALENPTVELGEDLNISEGQNITLEPQTTAENPSYQWSTGETTPTITVNTAGTYSLTLTDENGCMATDMVVVTVMTSLDNLPDETLITLSPNPSRDFVQLSFSDIFKEQLDITILNVNGMEIQHILYQKPSEEELLLDIHRLTSGIYVLKIQTERGIFTKKNNKAITSE